MNINTEYMVIHYQENGARCASMARQYVERLLLGYSGPEAAEARYWQRQAAKWYRHAMELAQ